MTTIDVPDGGPTVENLANVIGSYVLGLARRDPPDPWRVSDWLYPSV